MFPTLGGQITYFIYKNCHCLEKTRTRWNDFLFLITDDRDFRPQTCTNDLVFKECKHIKNIFEDVYFTKNSFHITLRNTKATIKSLCSNMEKSDKMQEECTIWKKGVIFIQHENNHFSTCNQRCLNFHIQLKINVDST